ncbi:hypothetical protein ACHAW5_002713 [Stephanodiscus triporus]|uniref:Uncharacterized protein n=1 Tax=Stephanodiscus triporus TaxID=2934178 RepID=A0ABD3MNB4_9STRA
MATASPYQSPVISTPSPSEGSTPNPVTAAPAPTPKPSIDTSMGCGDEMCDATETDGTCQADCEGIVLKVAGEGDVTSAPGTMFSVFSSRDVVLMSLDFYSDFQGVERVEVYMKRGAFEGHVSDRSAWKQVYNNYLDLGGSSISTQLNLNNRNGVPIPADEQVSFFIYTNSGVRGNVGTATGGTLTNDHVLTIFQGIVVEDKFTASDGATRPLSFKGSLK